jgi:hypothetical protein
MGLRICIEVEAERDRLLVADGRRTPQPPAKIDKIDSEVVERKQQEAGSREQRQLGSQIRDDERRCHGRTAGTINAGRNTRPPTS